ncbi:class I SAM-dependent methyltransferase [Actinomadura sp. DC4]|uniref:class I SAM-dependent methyltransferase n=1 Tax=Actinomadura sp. DC4 TaxID=3055069 RepID=UPI0025B27B3B|nr:class I SAM-dependent methyltransferase [Actinomadura sp. DC4]MDN3359871.1 class I SAM-dependent methyltransferase [Actinomadura sp. DC4]
MPRPEGTLTRGTTAPNRLRRVDRWITGVYGPLLRRHDRPLVVDLGYGASPVTTAELFTRLRTVHPRVDVVGIEIDPARVAAARPHRREGLDFRLGGFELPVGRPPALIRAFNVLRQYEEAEAWAAWDRLCARLAPDGVLVEGTCGEIGRRAVWVALQRQGAVRRPGRAVAVPRTITFAAHVASLPRPSTLAERLPKTLIHRNVPGERVHDLLSSFDRAWATAAPRSVFGPRQRWIGAVELLARDHPVHTRAPLGGRARWRLGEVTLPWSAVGPDHGAARA